MAVTADRYELPLIVRDSSKELAEAVGLCRTAMFIMASKGNTSKYTFNGVHYKIRRVE